MRWDADNNRWVSTAVDSRPTRDYLTEYHREKKRPKPWDSISFAVGFFIGAGVSFALSLLVIGLVK